MEMERKSTNATKLSRKRLRAVRKGFGDKDREREGKTYGPGLCEVVSG